MSLEYEAPRILIVGSSPIAIDHANAAIKAGFKVHGFLARSNIERCESVARQFGAECYMDTDFAVEKIQTLGLEAVLLATPPGVTQELTHRLLDQTESVILAEKPGALTNEALHTLVSHPHSNRVLVTFNRRYYKSVNHLSRLVADSNDTSLVSVRIGELPLGEKITGERMNRAVKDNSIHVLDILLHCFGDVALTDEIELVSSRRSQAKVLRAEFSSQRARGSILIGFGYPIRHELEVLGQGLLLRLSPMELLTVIEGMETVEPNPGSPNRNYVPKIGLEVDSRLSSSRYKAGFNEMWNSYHSYVLHSRNSPQIVYTDDRLATLSDARRAMYLAECLSSSL